MVDSEMFLWRSRFEHPCKEVFKWHKRPGAFERLQPPWEKIKLSRIGKGIQDGALLEIVVYLGFIKVRFIVEHQNYIEGKQFQDVQIEGPFRSWEHTHRFYDVDIANSEIEDYINYTWPRIVIPIKSFLNHYLTKKLDRVFSYRERILKHDLQIHKGTTPMKILISGSSGFIGSALIPFLTTGGHEVFKLIRHRTNLLSNEIAWDPYQAISDFSSLEGLDAVINLAGDNIASGRWTEKKKQSIYDSRVLSTKTLSQALTKLMKPPKVLISASAVGYYGNRGNEILTEKSSKGDGFLADVCQDWEEASLSVLDRGIRLVNLRLGIVLSPKGGVLKQMLMPFKLGIGGPVGLGQQYMSWIAIDDLLEMIQVILSQESLKGPINAVSPYPVTNQEFTNTLGKILNRPTWIRMPAFAAKLVFGEMADALLLSSIRVEPEVMSDSGFQFNYANLDKALAHELGTW